MRFYRRILSLLTLLLALLGFIGCIAGTIGLWRINTRLSQASQDVLGTVDASVVVVREGVGRARDRVETAKITTQDIEEGLKDWSKSEASQRLALRLDAAEKADRLAASLRQVDDLLEVSESSVGLVQQALSMATSSGAPMDTSSVDGLIERIASLRIQIAKATELATNIHERTTGGSEEKSRAGQFEQAVQLALRVVATLGSIGSLLEELDESLSETQNDVQSLKIGAQQWILSATIAITLLLLWMAAGQAALFWLAWQGIRATRKPPLE